MMARKTARGAAGGRGERLPMRRTGKANLRRAVVPLRGVNRCGAVVGVMGYAPVGMI